MMRWIRSLIHGHDIGNAVALARYYHRLGLACARRSYDQRDPWAVAARAHFAKRDARMWEARELLR